MLAPWVCVSAFADLSQTDTSSLSLLPRLAPPANGGDSGSNPGEAQLVLRFLQAAAAAGVAQEQLGVISPYRAQVCLQCLCWN